MTDDPLEVLLLPTRSSYLQASCREETLTRTEESLASASSSSTAEQVRMSITILQIRPKVHELIRSLTSPPADNANVSDCTQTHATNTAPTGVMRVMSLFLLCDSGLGDRWSFSKSSRAENAMSREKRQTIHGNEKNYGGVARRAPGKWGSASGGPLEAVSYIHASPTGNGGSIAEEAFEIDFLSEPHRPPQYLVGGGKRREPLYFDPPTDEEPEPKVNAEEIVAHTIGSVHSRSITWPCDPLVTGSTDLGLVGRRFGAPGYEARLGPL
ncbi:hypothetical protein BDK51DRAFT_42025 [Blyttiomyces helicus]|uniref:Uncharacterized protein n=1 Tax=Blyttiomyces helicus TaxID=388810 RepID=A0A4P9WIA6_9FUNG|nr:hypothetical protein BDK51DRAFT_42025 [Blyttiomyces helicus]|eukprot:RKO90286.1 hypothetical protein BDK51DRAFT_42025 [Blyttiomyces helicus]